MTNPAYTFEVTARQKLDLELAKPFDCVGGPGSPVPSFTANPTPPLLNQLTCFDAQGTTDNGSIISFTWTFGDGGTASGSIACHTFRRSGSIPVTLTVVDGDHNCVSLTQFFDVGKGGTPSCTFTASPNPVSTDTTINFDAAASIDSDGTIVSYKWDFGDAKTGSGVKTTHSYSVTGGFTVTLTVTDNAGNVATCNQTVTVGTGLPSCSFTIAPNPADVDETVVFDGSASKDPDGGVLSFAWDFDNDGQFNDATGAVATTSFSSPGTKLINLQVTDAENNDVVCTKSLDIGNRSPVCESFTADATNVIPGTTVNYTVVASDPDADPLSVKFTTTGGNPGGVVDSTVPFTHSSVYNNIGTFTATAVVSDGQGGTDICTPITITVGNTAPVCESFTATSTSITVGGSIDFAVTGSDPDGNPITVQFVTTGGNPGGSVDSTAPFQQLGTVYNTAGSFTAAATVKDSLNATTNCPDIPIIVNAVVPVVTVDPASAPEGNAGTSLMGFTVHLSTATTVPVTVNYKTVDGTAVAPGDYVAVASANIIIPAGSTSGTINVTINGDVTLESDETFQVQVTSITNGTGLPIAADGTILNDD